MRAPQELFHLDIFIIGQCVRRRFFFQRCFLDVFLSPTNIGLKKCIAETVPIGVIVQTDVKPNSKYRIAGTGIVKKWEDGYYHIDIFSDSGEIK